MEDFKVTRMELINLKQKIKLAEKGYNLLKKKRDALIAEFLALLGKTSDLRDQLNDSMQGANTKLAIAEAVDSKQEVEAASLAVRSTIQVKVDKRNVMGVIIPVVEYEGEIFRNYGLIGTSTRVDETSESYIKAVKIAVELAKYEIAIKKLLDETEKTKRRVNALEYIIIPRLKNAATYIRMRLDEMERDDFFRLKMVKKKISATEAA